jgi:histidinol-phosphate aminotransferase
MTQTQWLPAHIARLRPYEPGKSIEQVQREWGLSRVVKLASNESPYGPSPRALAAAHQALQAAHWYPDAGGYDLRADLAAYHGVSMREIALGAGSTELVQLLVYALLTPDDHAVVVDVTFPMYRLALEVARVPYTVVPLRDGRYDVEALARAVRPNTKMIFLANPNNPTGTYIPRMELEGLLEFLPPRVVVVHDEAYVHYVDCPDYPDGLTYYRRGAPVVVLRTFSKVYGLAGLRVGYAIGHPDIIRGIDTVRSPFNVSHVAQAAARAALADEAYVRTVVEATRTQRAWLTQRLTDLGWAPYPSQANFVCFSVGGDARVWSDRLLREGVIVRPLESFGWPTALRVTVGRPEDNMMFIEKMEKLRAMSKL